MDTYWKTTASVAIAAALIIFTLIAGATVSCTEANKTERSRHQSLVERCKVLAEKNLPCTSW